MASLTATELASIRADEQTAMPSTCTISRNTPSSDSQGGDTAVWTDIATGVPCRLSPLFPRGAVEATTGERTLAEFRFLLTLPAGTDIEAKDRVTVTGAADGGPHEVIGVTDRTPELVRRAEVQRLL